MFSSLKKSHQVLGVLVFKKSTVNERISRLRCEAGESDCWAVGLVNCNYYRKKEYWGFELHTEKPTLHL